MHEDIEKLRVLQERDRSIAHAEQEIAGLGARTSGGEQPFG